MKNLSTLFTDRSATLLNYFMAGHQIGIDGRTYVLCEVESGGKKGVDLCCIAHDDKGRERYLRLDISIGAFIAMCEKISDIDYENIILSLP